MRCSASAVKPSAVIALSEYPAVADPAAHPVMSTKDITGNDKIDIFFTNFISLHI